MVLSKCLLNCGKKGVSTLQIAREYNNDVANDVGCIRLQSRFVLPQFSGWARH
jgi:hypothetical protein